MGSCTSSNNVTPIVAYSEYIGNHVPGETRILRHPRFTSALAKYPNRKQTTIGLALAHSFRINDPRPCLGTLQDNTYAWQTYFDVEQTAKVLGSALVDLVQTSDFAEKEVKIVGIWSQSRAEWVIADLAAIQAGITTISIPSNIPTKELAFIIQTTQLNTLIVESEKHVEQCIELLAQSNIKNLITIEQMSESLYSKCLKQNLNVHYFADFFDRSRRTDLTKTPTRKDADISTLIYNRGSFKIVILTESNLIWKLTSYTEVFKLSSDDRHLSYLDVSQIFERMNIYAMLYSGARIGFHIGSCSDVTTSLSTLQPTVFFTVPHFLESLKRKVQLQIRGLSDFKQRLISTAVAAKIEILKSQAMLKHQLYDAFVLDQFKNLLGGSVRRIFSAASLTNPSTITFLKVILGVPIIEGYGFTEVGGPATLTNSHDSEGGHIGGLMPWTELKLVDVPQVNYKTHAVDEKGFISPYGEIWMRGGSIAERCVTESGDVTNLLDIDRWYHTGDIGYLHWNGSLSLVDRASTYMNLSNGDQVDLVGIELVLNKSPVIDCCFVTGAPYEAEVLTAVVLPNLEKVQQMDLDLSFHGLADIVAADHVRKAVKKEIKSIWRSEDLPKSHIPGKVVLIGETFDDLMGFSEFKTWENRITARRSLKNFKL